ncbi:ATP synthase F0 subunit B [Planctomicrobium piriforme]|uniref:ATP synthase subunit b n=1 Tax=Planctomicrobium piriforme TaxID=1576369 RepID=A0A1I3S4J7_9PLAN|nr:ATP synthase F0 subunit B [Planctomicrobium piriforme]SFJ53538.1 F-type H+-transporting ATPase subunit b [Planctomicrobium piriforme]
MRDQRHHSRRLSGLALLAGLFCLVTGTDAFALQKPAHEHPIDGQAIIEHASGEHLQEPVKSVPNYKRPPLAFDLTMFLFTFLLFGGFVLAMRPLVWQPLIAGLDAREGRIAQAEADARASRLEVQQLTAQAERRLAEVQQQVGAMLAKARSEAEATKAQIMAQAEADAQRVKQEALAAIAQAKAEAIDQLEQVTGEQVSLATEHLAGMRF